MPFTHARICRHGWVHTGRSNARAALVFLCDVHMRSAGAALYLKDVALLDGGVLQLAGLLLQSLSRAANWQAGQYLLWQPEGALTLLHSHHLLLEALHFHQETLR